jgi:hypothetical protein
MKRLLIIISMTAIMFADSPVGNWKLSGLRVDYFDIARADATVALYDAYGFGIAVPVAQIPAGLLFNQTINGPFTDAELQGAGVNLNVNLYPDGTGVIGEGSYYPDVETGTNPDGSSDCITTGQIFPITDNFNWETDQGQEGNMFPYVNILGIPSPNAWAGQTAYGLGVNGSGVFDNWGSQATAVPTPSVLPGIFLADGTVLSMPSFYGGTTAGAWGGYYRQGDLGESQVEGNSANDVKFLLEWSAIDGWESESGLGDDLTIDEDGDGTDYDRIFGLPYITATYVSSANPLCDITGGALAGAPGLTYPVAGDIVDALGGEAAVGALVTGSCLQGVANGAYDSCLGQVQDGVEAQCDAAGSPVNAVTGLCYDASQTPDFAGACAYYGAATALVVTCQQLGFDDETCAAAGQQGVDGVEAYCMYMTGFDCATAGIDQCSVLTDPTFAGGLCEALASSLTESETCEEWAGSFDEEWLDNTATQVLGVTCTDFAAGLQGGLAAGDAGTIATIDGLFAGVAGMTCSEYGASYVGMCVESVSPATTMYLMDPSLEAWGLFLTYNAASVQQYQAAGYSLETIMMYFPELFVNDSGTDFDPSCYYTGETCGGRLLMNFEPTCIPEVEAHQIIAEFVDLDGLGCGDWDGYLAGDVAGGFEDLACSPSIDADGYPTGCVCDYDGYGGCLTDGGGLECVDEFLCYDGYWNEEFESSGGDGIVNVVDVIKLIGHILGDTPLGGYLLCNADLNGDGIVNVVDVVGVVNTILGNGLSSANDSKLSEATITYDNDSISISSKGNVNAIDMTIEFKTEKFDLEINSDYIGDYIVNGKTAHIIITGFSPLDKEIITINNGTVASINGDAANMQGLISLKDGGSALPQTATVSAAYPNPFNPSTSFSMDLSVDMDVTVKVFNLTGQLVDVIADGQLTKGEHTFMWNASNLASGVYFISTHAGNDLSTQKVMLIK